MCAQLSAGSSLVDLASEQCKRPPAPEFPLSLTPHSLIPWHRPPRCHPLSHETWELWSTSTQGPGSLPASSRGRSLLRSHAGPWGQKKERVCDCSRVAEMLRKPNPARQQRAQPCRTHLPSPAPSSPGNPLQFPDLLQRFKLRC